MRIVIKAQKLGGIMGAPAYGIPRTYIAESLKRQTRDRELKGIQKRGRGRL